MANYKPIGVPFDRTFRNDLNANFQTIDAVAAEARVKAINAEVGVSKAVEDSFGAKKTAESVQTQLNNIIIESGTSDAEVIQARGSSSVLNERLNGVDAQLAESPKYPILSVEIGKVVKRNLPYGHVERYGADPKGIADSTIAIQTAVDVMEELARGISTYSSGFFKVQFGSGDYKITKTIRLKYSKNSHNATSPISLVGNERKRVSDQLGKGTVIRPLIPNHVGKSYANAFSVNIKYNSETDEDDTISFDAAPLQTMNSIMFKDISFTLSDTEASNYNICAIKGYRFRMDGKNLLFTNMWRGIWQPEKDRINQYSYCDFSNYEEISFTGIKHIGLELYNADNSSVKGIYNHKLKPSFDSVIKLTKGAGIKIERFMTAIHGEFDVNGVFVPRNDGTGQTGTKAMIKLVDTYGVSVESVYTERPFGDYVFHLTNVTNLDITNYYERFVGNGFVSINGNCRNIKVENTYRYGNIVSEFLDFYVNPIATIQNIKIKNFVPRNWYSETLAISSTLTGLTTLPESTYTTRDIKHNFSQTHYKHIEGEFITFKLQFDGSNWITRDVNDNDMSPGLGSFSWSSDGVTFSGSKLTGCKIISAQEGYVSATSLPHVPIVRGSNTEKIRFFDRTTGQAVPIPDTKCCVLVTVSCVLNTTRLP